MKNRANSLMYKEYLMYHHSTREGVYCSVL